MRLLHASTFELAEFLPKKIPEYAILSHVWGKEEVLYQDVINGTAQSKLGWSKVKQCCRRAREDGFEYVWIDTCCIDKTNSVELSMAINSMFAWYEQAAVCYAYLNDVDTAAYSLHRQLERSKWFTRGWTLQELLAPKFVVFIGQAWQEFGTRSSLSHLLESVTQIKAQHLVSFKACNIATKMSWAASRSTTLIEDEAYSLLGLFNIHLSLIYGEGSNALIRLQQELLRAYNDESVLAWNAYGAGGRLLALSPSAFHNELIPLSFDPERPESFFTNKGLVISPLLYQQRGDDGLLLNKYLLPLNCGLPDGSAAVALTLKSTGNDTFQRIDCEKMRLFPMTKGWEPTEWASLGRRKICIEQKTGHDWLSFDRKPYLLQFQHPPELRMQFVDSFWAGRGPPEQRWRSVDAAQAALEAVWDDGFVQMPFGKFVLARFEVEVDSAHFVFAMAIRRCDQSLTVQCWNSDSTDGDFADVIASFQSSKPSPGSRTDFVELLGQNDLRVHIQLKPRGWPVERNKLSPAARAVTVSITVPKADDMATKNIQESKTWQNLIDAVNEFSGDFEEL